MRIRNGDHVVVISGKDKGKTGTVLRVLPEKQRLVIGGINMRIKHVRGTPQRPGQRLEYEASIAVSNVMLIDPKTKKRTRIGYSFTDKGVKQRIAKRSGEVLLTKKAAAPVKKDATKKATAKTADKKEVKETQQAPVAEEGKKLPVKKPFWKRLPT
jgi:large subunit ribosomal protein L24